MSTEDLKELQKLIEQEVLKNKKQDVNQQPSVTPKKRENKDVLAFIRKFNIAPGENKVPNYVIYHQFALWANSTNWRKVWGKEEFFRTFKNHFEQKRSGNQRFYLINDGLDLSDEMYERAKKYDQKHQKRKQKSKN